MSRLRLVAAGCALLAFLAPGLEAQPGSPAGPVPVELLRQRRDAAIERLDAGMLILGSEHLRELSDHPQASDFRQDNDFFYLTGLETPDSWLVLYGDGAAGPGAVLYLPPRDPGRERWTGPELGPGREATQLSGIADVRPPARFARDVQEWLTRRRSGGAPHLFVSSGSARNDTVMARITAGHAGEVRTAREVLAPVRLVKDEDELRRLRRAIEITGEAQREAMRVASPGMYEYELEAAIEYVFRVSGAERVGFPSIVGSGPNSVTLHYDKSRRKMEEGDLVVVDIGAEFGYYTADVTRTIPVSGAFSPRQRALYELVLRAQEAALAALRPGITVKELDSVARVYMDRHSGTLCGEESCTRFFVHGLGHWLGMNVHDVGDYRTPLEPGMVLTIEPGLYLPDEEIGIRIEDDVLITPDGYELLTADVPRTPDAVEAMMREEPAWVR